MKHIDLTNTPVETVIKETIAALQSGGLVLFPTETTYGAGVDATNQKAVDKLLTYKSRREGKPLSILVANKNMAKNYVEINEQANKLYNQFLPGPVTVVSKSLSISSKNSNSDINKVINTAKNQSKNTQKYKVASGVTSEFGTLGVRIPDYNLMLKISENFGKPITATSANASGKKRPYKIDDIFSNLSEKQKSLVDLVLDAGTLDRNDPSTVIDTTLSTPVTLRKSNRLKHTQESEKISNQELDVVVIDSDGNNNSSNDSAGSGEITKNIISTTTIISRSEQETKDIAGRLLLKHWNDVNKKGFVIALDGDLGIGKTIFTKGSAKFLNIEDIIKSPTYSYIEEYDFSRHQTKGQLFHLDMWKVEDENMFNRLEINKLIKPNNIIIIEWFSQIKSFIEPLLKNVKVVKINFSEIDKDDSDIDIDNYSEATQSRKLEIIESENKN